MSEKFVASNGGTVEFGGTGRLAVTDHNPEQLHEFARTISRTAYVDSKQADALREFFQHERDTELGRWRDPDSPYLVVYAPNEEGKVRVVDEHAGWGWEISPESKAYAASTLFDVVKAGHHYFEAHPEPKPWHDAKPGEVWAVTTENVADEVALQVTPHDTFQYNDGNEWGIRDLPVVTARRIFPEVMSDDS